MAWVALPSYPTEKGTSFGVQILSWQLAYGTHFRQFFLSYRNTNVTLVLLGDLLDSIKYNAS